MKRKAHTTMPRDDKPQPLTHSRAPLLICIALVFGTLLLYMPVTNHQFTMLDDMDYVVNNPHVRQGLSLQSIQWALTAFYASNWHPLAWMSHMADIQLYGLNPTGHHLTSVLLHVINSLLLFVVLRRMTRSTWRSGFVAALFAWHPLHVESVAWVAERKDVLSTMFWMLTIWAYAAYSTRRTIGRYLLVVLAFGLGLMAKPMLVSLPLVLLALDYWPLHRLKSGKIKLISLLLEKTPLFAMSLGACVLTMLAQRTGGAVRSFDTYPLGVRAANAVVAYVTYIVKMLLPSNLSFFYPHPDRSLPTWEIIGASAVLAAVTWASVRLRRRAPYLLSGWIWFVVTLVPVIGLLQVGGQAMADRYTYIPLIGLFVTITWGARDLVSPKYAAIPAVAVLAGLAILTSLQIGCWRSDRALLDQAMRSTHGNYVVRTWMSDYLIREGNVQKAKALLEPCTPTTPGYAHARNALGCILIPEGKLAEAEAEYHKALRVRPGMAEAHNNLGTLLAKRGDMNAALSEFTRAVQLDPGYSEAQFNAGAALAAMGRPSPAIRHLELACKSSPDNVQAHCRAAVLLIQTGKTGRAIDHLQAALEIEPKQAEAQLLLGTALQQKGDLAGAIDHFAVAVELRSDWGLAHANLAMALFAKGDLSASRHEADLATACHYRLPDAFVKALRSKTR